MRVICVYKYDKFFNIICYSFTVDLEILNTVVLKLDFNSQNMVIENSIKIKF